jgi:hypothetical protein
VGGGTYNCHTCEDGKGEPGSCHGRNLREPSFQADNGHLYSGCSFSCRRPSERVEMRMRDVGVGGCSGRLRRGRVYRSGGRDGRIESNHHPYRYATPSLCGTDFHSLRGHWGLREGPSELTSLVYMSSTQRQYLRLSLFVIVFPFIVSDRSCIQQRFRY